FTELRKGTEKPSEYRVLNKSGDIRWARTKTRPIMENGQFKGARGILIDVTDQRRAEEVLRENEELFRSYLENAPDAIYTSDLKGNFLYGNRKCEEIIGYRREELIGKSFLELNILPEKSLNKAAQLLQANIEGKSTGPDEIELISKEGRAIPVEINTSVVQRMGQPIVLGFVRDITQRKRAEETLRESEEKYHWVLDNMADVIAVMDMNLRFTYVSPSIVRMRGYTVEEAMAQTFEQVMTPESLQISAKVFEEEMKLEAGGTADPGRIRILEVEQYTKDGSIVLMENHLSFLRDEAQKPVGIISVSHDITQRKRAEKALKESENKYRLLADNVNDVIFVLDMNLNYTYISPSVKILRGYEPEEALKLPSSETLTSSSWDLARRTLSEVMELEKSEHPDIPISRTLQLEVNRKDGTTVWTEMKFSFIRDQDRRPTGILGLTRDITDRKRAEEKLQDTLESLRKSFGAIVQVMISAVESRDPYTAGHQVRSANLARVIATEMRLPQ
ncbi:MAG: PAS domain S-box protein, partial [Rectinemataceae bacterium]|nr:PAS domain S-box protein [Rectinemataceae bacterium]